MLCLGTADMGAKIPRDDAFALLDAYVDAGGTFIDTAEIYSDWVPGEKSRSEKLIGDWLQKRRIREQIVLATKGAHPRLQSMTTPRMTRSDIEHDLTASLANLRTDVIDLYWLHRDDPSTPVEDIIDTMNAQVSAGRIKHFGCSNWRADRIHAANAHAARQGVQGFAANQPMWSLAKVHQASLGDQTCVVMDDAMHAMHDENWARMHSLFITGQRLLSAHGEWDCRRDERFAAPHVCNRENAQRATRVQQVAKEAGMSISEVVLAYLLSQPFTVFPIIGCRSLAQLRDTLSAHDKRLSPAQVAFLEGRM